MSDRKNHGNSVNANSAMMAKVTVFTLAFIFLFVGVFSVAVLSVTWTNLLSGMGILLSMTVLFMGLSYAASACKNILTGSTVE